MLKSEAYFGNSNNSSDDQNGDLSSKESRISQTTNPKEGAPMYYLGQWKEMDQAARILSVPLHPAETSNNSDICDFLKVSDIENSMVANGKMYILKHSS